MALRHSRVAFASIAVLVLAVAPAVGSAADGVLLGLPAGASLTDDGRLALPLAAPVPAWYSTDVHARVVAAGERGLAFDVERGVEVPLATQFLFIRPGAMMLFPAGCTMNFVYGSPGSYLIGSAGHCAERGDNVVILAAPTLVASIGRVKSVQDAGVGKDWLLVSVDARFQQHVDPNVAVIGGPQGGDFVGEASITSPVPIKHFGHGVVVGAGGTPRAGVSTRMDSSAFFFDSAAAPGDSGSPVLVAGSADAPLGQAVGVLTHLVVGTRTLPSVIAGTRVTAIPADVVDGDVNPMP